MRILFVSGVDVGGAPASTVELARRLNQRGHAVGVLLGAEQMTSRGYQKLLNVSIKLYAVTGWSWPRELLRRFGTGGEAPTTEGGVLLWRRSNAANSLRPVVTAFSPDLIVANSHSREHLRWMLKDAQEAGVPVALYMREAHSVTHLLISQLDLDLVFANSQRLAQEAEAAGYPCVYAPSIVDVQAAEVDSSRESIVLINPVPENRPEIMRELAAHRPDLRVVLQESWPLEEGWRSELKSWTTELPNLTLRPRQKDPREIYRDAKLIVATYPSGRPRVVLEAQHNAIPVAALAQPALIEAVGDGGVLIPPDADDASWVRAITTACDDPDRYGALCRRALQHSKREEVDPDVITRVFEQALMAVTR